ncbi:MULTISPECIES: FeoA family protein [Aestuariimicrobium]|uniref:FeoA family protein n=1 Tax=Aestuariimicrobium TaxID=396388 RepID=UPI0003B6D9E3|nr:MULTISPECIES: FeoA family protein [Aestuariimicrobium]CAI9407559.1 hypothetical protein AESSP_01846 [Aestuariimicrobium sp. T2.26MG-19.2B]
MTTSAACSVLEAPLNIALTLVEAQGSPGLLRRLAALGIRRGHRLEVVLATAGGGRVVSLGDSRLALGRDLAAALMVQPR